MLLWRVCERAPNANQNIFQNKIVCNTNSLFPRSDATVAAAAVAARERQMFSTYFAFTSLLAPTVLLVRNFVEIRGGNNFSFSTRRALLPFFPFATRCAYREFWHQFKCAHEILVASWSRRGCARLAVCRTVPISLTKLQKFICILHGSI